MPSANFGDRRSAAVTGRRQARQSSASPISSPCADRDALVEDEALALPEALFGGHVFEIFQDAALEMEDIVDAERADIGGRLLAANAAGAEHGDLLAFEFVAVARDPVGKIAKARRLRIESAGEAAERDLVVVARVDDDRAGVGDQRVPVAGIDIGAGVGERIDVGTPIVTISASAAPSCGGKAFRKRSCI